MFGDRCLRVAHHAFILLLVVASAVVLSAQTVVDPRYVEFTPSADHSTNASDGTPLVQRYSLSVYVAGSSVAFDTMDLGKPAPSGGVIRVDFLPLLHSVPTPGVVFEARVTAVGPGGSTASSLSNGFSFQAACAPTINSTGQSVGSGAGTGSVGVTAGTGCSWSAASNANWITLTGATGGTGNGSVPYSFAANTGSARTGTLTVAGQTYTVNQAALSCSYTVSPTSQAMPVGGGPGLTDVTAPGGCAWTAVSNNTGWLTVTSGASGSGNGTVAFSTTANPNGTARSGTITIGSRTFSVTQAAAPCTYSLTPASQSMAFNGGTGTTTVAAPAGCAWTGVSNNTGWLTVTSGASGSGNGSVGFSASANARPSPRTGTVTVGGQALSVTQAGAPCTYAISPTSQSIAAGSTTGSTTVTAPNGCTWSGVSNDAWLTVTSGGTGNGNGSVGFSASANTSTSQRSGTLTVAGQTFTVTQAGAGCTFAISSNSVSMAAAGGTSSTNVTSDAGCPWSAASNDNWITVTSGASGDGNGSVGFSVAANPTTSLRTGSLTIASRTFTVSQAAAACSYSLTPSSQAVASTGGGGSTSVSAASGCAWTAASNNGWLTVTSSATGSGNGSVGFSASANTNSSPRSGTLTVAGQTFTVTQSGAGCTLAISSNSWSAPAPGGAASTNVTAGAGCPWSAASNNTWIAVTSGASGSGNGTVRLSVTANPNPWGRSGTLTIATQTFTVSQASSSCTYSLNPTSRNIASTAVTTTTVVTTGAGCVWTAVSNATGWLSLNGSATGTGTGTVSLRATANTTAQARVGTVAISGQTFTVTQAASACSYVLTPANRTIGGDGGTGTITVGAGSGCSWTTTTTQSWISVSGSGTAAGSVTYTVSRNTGTTQRTGSINIGTQAFTITQSAATNTPAAPSGLRIAGSD